MPKNSSKVFIDGSEVLADATFQVEITQVMGTHNRFAVSFPTSSKEGYSASLMDDSINYIGKKISISYEDGFEFVGLINDVQLSKNNAATGVITISGFSPDVLLSHRYNCMSFEEGFTLQDVISEAIKEHSTEALKKSFGHQMGTTLPYTVQYNESDYAFVHRMCSRYGKWLYNNGKEFCIGRVGEKTVEGIYGKELRTFGLQGSLQEQTFSINQHDWVNNAPLDGQSSSSSPAANHPYIQTVKQNSDFLYKTQGYYHWVHGQPEFSSQQGIDEATKAHTLARTSNMLRAVGTSILYKLRLGDTLKIQGFNFTDDSKKDTYGSYMITKITHRFSSSGNYVNSFEGVPEGTEYPAYSNAFSYPRAESQRAIVKDNADPEGLGRIKVQFPWQQENGDNTTPWIKMTTPYAGADKGFYFIPEVEEEVLVGFEGGNAERPFILSAGFNTTANSPFADPDNNIKAIKTRSGNIIELNDSNGAEMITITDKDGNSMHINTSEGKMIFTALGDMEFNAKNVRFNVQEDMDVNIGKNKTEAIKEKLEISANNSSEQIFKKKDITVGDKLEQVSGELTMQTNEGKMLIDGKGKVTIQSAEDVDYGD